MWGGQRRNRDWRWHKSECYQQSQTQAGSDEENGEWDNILWLVNWQWESQVKDDTIDSQYRKSGPICMGSFNMKKNQFSNIPYFVSCILLMVATYIISFLLGTCSLRQTSLALDLSQTWVVIAWLVLSLVQSWSLLELSHVKTSGLNSVTIPSSLNVKMLKR